MDLCFGRTRADFADPEDVQFVHLYKGRSVAGLITQRRRLGSVFEVLGGMRRNGICLSRSLELGTQRGAVVSAGPQGLVVPG